MKIRGNTVGTPIKPKVVMLKADLTEEEKAQARANIGAVGEERVLEIIAENGGAAVPVWDGSYTKGAL